MVVDVKHTHELIKDGLKNTFLMHRATLASGHGRYRDIPVIERASVLSSTQDFVTEDRSQQGTYAVEKNARHVGKGAKLRYVVRWYGYT